MRVHLQAVIVVAGLLLSACSKEEVSEVIFPDEVRKQLNLINDAIINRDHEALRATANTPISDEEFKANLEKVFTYLPGGTFVGRELVSYNISSLKTVRGIDRTTYSAGYQYEYTGGWVYVELKLRAENGKIAFQTLNMNQLTQSLRELNAFTFAGKREVHYLVFALAVLTPIFIIATFVVCFRTRNLKRRKRWLAFIVIGVSGVVLNWTTGAIVIKILNVGLLGAGFNTGGALAPVMLKVWFPLGAVLFWGFRQSGKLAFVSEQSIKDNHSE